MGYYDSANLFPFDNEVLEQTIEDQLMTRLDMFQFATADYSLTENEGNVKKVRTYIGTGDVEDVEMGEGNTKDIGAGYVETDYRVVYTQGRFPYYDEQVNADRTSIEAGVKRLSTQMINDLTQKVIAEFNNATLVKIVNTWDFDAIVDARAMMPDELLEDVFILINPQEEATIKKNAKDYLSYPEAFIRTGAVGALNNYPIYVSKAIPKGVAFLANPEAVTVFVKEGAAVEQDRDPNLRKNTVYARKCSVVALTDADKVVKLIDGSQKLPTSENEGLKIAMADNDTFKISGKGVKLGVVDTELFGDRDDVVEVVLPNACQKGTHTIVQVNPALAKFEGDPDIALVDGKWTKTKEYTFAEPDAYALVLAPGEGEATVTIDGELYATINYKFS